jgi:long-chain acyl-CoA synthetase
MFVARIRLCHSEQNSAHAHERAAAHNYDARPWIAHYPPGVAADCKPLAYEHLGHLFYATAAKYGSLPCFAACLPNGFAGQLTYTDVDRLSNDFAGYLRLELGLQQGDRVALQMPNCLSWPIMAMGILKAGCVLVNINPLYTESEMEHALADSGAKVLCIIDLFADKLDRVVPRTQVRHIVTAGVAGYFPFPLRTIVKLKLKLSKMLPHTSLKVTTIEEAVGLGNRRAPRSQDWNSSFLKSLNRKNGDKSLGLDDIAVLQYTGGTTGRSKGAMLTHRNIMSNVNQVEVFGSQVFERGREVILTALPLYHIFAFTVNFITFYHLGSLNVLVPNPRPLGNLRKCFEKYRFTSITGVNTLYNALADEPWFKTNPPAKLRLSIAGGAALQSAVAEKWHKASGCPVIEGYGLTESSPVLTFNPIGGGRAKAGSIGVPLPSTHLRIIDEAGRPMPQGEIGEIAARGDQVMLGYWQRPDSTSETIVDGWLRTGDIGFMDNEGYFRIVDRKKDMINVSGFNVYPNEVEEAIMRHPDVAECAVIGVPDEHSGEAVRAYIVLKPGKTMNVDTLREHCRDSITAYKLPKQLKVVSELPKTPVGKILRKDLRAEAAKESTGVTT